MPNLANWGTRCTAQLRGGEFCDDEAMPGAPFPICRRHVRKAYAFGRQLVQNQSDGNLTLDVVKRFAEHGDNSPRLGPSPGDPVVYYLQVGDTIKIGFSTNLAQRLKAYPPTRKLLAVEPGSWGLEGRRHNQFKADLVAGNEWFRPSDALLSHIASLT